MVEKVEDVKCPHCGSLEVTHDEDFEYSCDECGERFVDDEGEDREWSGDEE